MLEKIVDSRNVFEVKVAGGGKGLDVYFERYGGIKSYPKAVNL